MILGNHDDKRIYRLKHMFESISPLKDIKSNGQHIVLCHYGLRVWNRSHHGSWMLYGHSHGTLERHPSMPSFDVGVDSWDYKPASFNQIKQYVEENY